MKWFSKITLLIIFLSVAGVVLATDNPGFGEPVEYDGTLQNGVTESGSIGWSNPNDGYDWYCFNVTSGQEVQVDLDTISGDLRLNGTLWEPVAEPGGTAGDLSSWGDTSNSSSSDVQFAATPGFSGPATLSVSTWSSDDGGVYEVTVTGISALTSDCQAQQISSVPASSTWSLIVLLMLFALVSFGWFGRKPQQ